MSWGMRGGIAETMFFGCLIPAYLLEVVAVNVARCEVYSPRWYDRYYARVYGDDDRAILFRDDVAGVAGVVLIKLALALGLFARCALANFKRTERASEISLQLAIVLAAVGLVILLILAVFRVMA